jgi:uncharacterized repeat protein (TIGR03803 family)
MTNQPTLSQSGSLGNFRLGSFAQVLICALTLVTMPPALWAATNWQEKVLHNFGGSDGMSPPSSLVSDAAGNLYGTTTYGGTYNYGTVFEMSPDQRGAWTETVLHSFNNDGTDGWYPTAGSLTFDAAGNLYGSTQYGQGYGTVFEMSPIAGGGWTEKVVYNFRPADGSAPLSHLIFDATGNLYGTADFGGAYCFPPGCGTVFELSPNGSGSWTATVLHNFNLDGTDGAFPLSGLIFDAAGNLYGTTSGGGTHNPGGIAFELSPDGSGGWMETILHTFGTGQDGADPYAGLTFDSAGNLYGTTNSGGVYGNYGTLFELTPNGSGSWTETVLHSFGNGTDGFGPLYGSLIFDASGNLYGTTTQGGINGGGTVFEFTPNGSGGWTETVLHSFGVLPDGDYPFAGVTFDAVGNLYGTTDLGGSNLDGTVFELSPIYPCAKCSHVIQR